MISIQFIITLKVSVIATIQEKDIKGIKIGKKKFKLLLFTKEMIMYLKHPMDSTRKLLNLIDNFNEVEGYYIKVQK